MADVLERLKILIDSSTPIIVMETVEEMRAVQLVREASSPLNLAVFEWSIASGLVRCGTEPGAPRGRRRTEPTPPPKSGQLWTPASASVRSSVERPTRRCCR